MATNKNKDDSKSTMDADGLRYLQKPAGSPFARGGTTFLMATMSCFLCGKHRPRPSLKTRTLLGKVQNVCAPSCKALQAQLDATVTGSASSA